MNNNQLSTEYEYKRLLLNQIDTDNDNPRFEDKSIGVAGLMDTIKDIGIIHEPVVNEKNGKYKLIAGSRRFDALKKLGKLSAIFKVYHNLSTEKEELIRDIENIQRVNLSAIELGKKFLDYKKKYHFSAEEIASKFGVTKSFVATSVRVFENIPESIQKTMIVSKNPQHPRAGITTTVLDRLRRAKAKNPEINDKQYEALAEKIKEEGYSTRDVNRIADLVPKNPKKLTTKKFKKELNKSLKNLKEYEKMVMEAIVKKEDKKILKDYYENKSNDQIGQRLIDQELLRIKKEKEISKELQKLKK